MENVAIYLRKSRGEIEDLDKHKCQLIELASKENWKYDIFEEIGTSDSIVNRSEIKKLLDAIKENKYKKVLVVAIDRFSRNEFDQAEITKTLREHNVKVVTPTKQYDLNTENDLLMSDFEKLLARQEYRLIKKRLFQGKENGAKQGYWTNGTPPIPYRYNKIDKKLEIDKEKHWIYRLIIDKMLEGYTTNSIAWELNKLGVKSPHNSNWHNNTVRRIAIDITHLGRINYKGKEYQGRHEAVKTQDEHERIRLFLARMTKAPKRVKNKQKDTFALSGLVKCEKCGATHYLYQKKNHDIYVRACWKYSKYGEKCKNKGIKESIILDEVIKAIYAYSKKLQRSIENGQEDLYSINGLENQISIIKKKLSKYDKTELKIKEMIKESIYSIEDGKEELRKIELDKENDSKLLHCLEQQISKLDIKHKERRLLDVKKILSLVYEKVSEKDLNDLLRNIIRRIEWKRDENNIKIDIQFL